MLYIHCKGVEERKFQVQIADQGRAGHWARTPASGVQSLLNLIQSTSLQLLLAETVTISTTMYSSVT